MNLRFFLFLITPLSAFADPSSALIDETLKKEFSSKYELANYLKPQLLQIDLDGDQKKDTAALINDSKTKKAGLLIIHAKGRKAFILAAGSKFYNLGDDLKAIKPLKWSA